MSGVYELSRGDTPLLISVPHDGRTIPDAIAARMTEAGRAIPDTDWHVARLYDFAPQLGAGMIVANYSRYVVDLNRSRADETLYPGQVATGLCPEQTFAGDALYAGGAVTNQEKAARIARYWQPYHDAIAAELRALRERFGYALLWDAHSIPSAVPRLFDGELPVLNLGSFSGASCSAAIRDAVHAAATASRYSNVLDGRFKGGFITRNYGQPDTGIHALQLEIAQRAYMDESSGDFDESGANTLRVTLKSLLLAFQDAARC